MTTIRRLAAILAADVAGYSRLIGQDEEGTLNRLKSIRAELIDPKISEHRGRIVKTTGDGLLVEFASVVDALRCASEWQAGMAERNASLAPVNRIEFRIGVHHGDIVVDGDDIFGDGVNVAARLEGLAEPGGIYPLAVSGGRPRCEKPLRVSLKSGRYYTP
jgi:adenylate cyclase